MARSRSLAVCLLITRMFMFLLICLGSTKAAMGYYLLLATGRSCLSGVRADILIPPFWPGVGLLRRRDVYSCEALGFSIYFISVIFFVSDTTPLTFMV